MKKKKVWIIIGSVLLVILCVLFMYLMYTHQIPWIRPVPVVPIVWN